MWSIRGTIVAENLLLIILFHVLSTFAINHASFVTSTAARTGQFLVRIRFLAEIGLHQLWWPRRTNRVDA